MHSQWDNLRNQFSSLNLLTIKRQVTCQNPVRIDLHGFCDASMDAYGACIYLRSLSHDNNIQVSLLCSKVRVSPLKTLTIPRLELCGVLLLTKLVNKVINSMDLDINCIYLWCDSTVVLAWIRTCPSLLQTFVSNRVSQIQDLSNEHHWRYIRSQDNPADILSRGVFPEKILSCRNWWYGPDFLSEEEKHWPAPKFEVAESLPERKRERTLGLMTTVEFNFPKILVTFYVSIDL